MNSVNQLPKPEGCCEACPEGVWCEEPNCEWCGNCSAVVGKLHEAGDHLLCDKCVSTLVKRNPNDPTEQLDLEWVAHLYGIDVRMLEEMPWLGTWRYCNFCNKLTAFQNNSCKICGWNLERTYRRNPSHVRLFVTGNPDWGEFIVEYHLDDEYQEGPTYYADELDDALETAQAMKQEAEEKFGHSAEIDVDPELMGEYQDNPYRRNVVIATGDDVRGHDRFMAQHIPEVTIKGRQKLAEVINSGNSYYPHSWRGGDCEDICCSFDPRTCCQLYHVTFYNNIHSILEKGVLPEQPQVWPDQTEFGYIYAFADVRDALRWADRTSFQPGMPKTYAIIGIEAEWDEWEDDPNQGMIYSGLNEGGWFRSKDDVDPDDIKLIIKYQG